MSTTTTPNTPTVKMLTFTDCARYVTPVYSCSVFLSKSEAWEMPATPARGLLLYSDTVEVTGRRVWVNVSENHPFSDWLLNNGWSFGWDVPCEYDAANQ